MMISKINILFLFLISAFAINANAGNQPRIAESAEEVCPVLTGTTIPDVTVNSIDDEQISLRTLVSEKPAVIIFYRGGWCPYCNTHLAELYDAEKSLSGMGYQIIAISMDQPSKLRSSLDEGIEVNYNLYSDSDAEASKAFGLAFKVEDELVEKYVDYGIDLEAASGQSHHILPVPAAFIVDTEGMIHFSYVNPDYKTRIKSEVLLKAAEAALE